MLELLYIRTLKRIEPLIKEKDKNLVRFLLVKSKACFVS